MDMDSKTTLQTAWLGTAEYEHALQLQDAMVAARHEGRIGDTLLLLEHPHVYTLGRGAAERYLTAPPPDVPIYRVSRGGQVTYHGPGQIIGYPILKLEGSGRDVHGYLRALESVIIATLRIYGIQAQRRERLTGVWVGSRKIASIGVGIRRWITLHGFALNANSDLAFFERIVPCGIEGCQMTSMAREGRREVALPAVASALAESFAAVFGYQSITPLNREEMAFEPSPTMSCERISLPSFPASGSGGAHFKSSPTISCGIPSPTPPPSMSCGRLSPTTSPTISCGRGQGKGSDTLQLISPPLLQGGGNEPSLR
jgi:lipoyl(octanoyl) transferase